MAARPAAKAGRPVVKANNARVDRSSKSDIIVSPSILSGKGRRPRTNNKQALQDWVLSIPASKGGLTRPNNVGEQLQNTPVPAFSPPPAADFANLGAQVKAIDEAGE